jgi:AhpD family alkylhydroperoxidase
VNRGYAVGDGRLRPVARPLERPERVARAAAGPMIHLDLVSHWRVLDRHGVGTSRRRRTVTAKLDPFAAAPGLMKTWTGASVAIASSLEPALVRLVEIRASQINGCANCINMHTAEARANGETEQRIYLLSAWREAPCYTDRERAALGWTEALTRLSEGRDLERAYEALWAEFTEEEQVKLTLMINVINGWNRISVGFGLFVDPAVARAAAVEAAA